MKKKSMKFLVLKSITDKKYLSLNMNRKIDKNLRKFKEKFLS